MNPLLLLALLAHLSATPLCLPAATVEAMRQLGAPMELRTLASQLPVHRDGVDLFDLRIWLQDHGWDALVAAPDRAVIERLVRAGHPVVLLVAEAGGVHAVTLLSADDQTVRVFDSRASAILQRPWRSTLLSAHAALVLWKANRGSPGALIGDQAWRKLVAQDQEFVAAGWLRRAAEHKTANAQKRELVLKALEAARGNAEARAALQEIDAQLRAAPGQAARMR